MKLLSFSESEDKRDHPSILLREREREIRVHLYGQKRYITTMKKKFSSEEDARYRYRNELSFLRIFLR